MFYSLARPIGAGMLIRNCKGNAFGLFSRQMHASVSHGFKKLPHAPMRNVVQYDRLTTSIHSPFIQKYSFFTNEIPFYRLYGPIRCLTEGQFTRNRKESAPKVPFMVFRTQSGNLPIYSKIRKHGTIVTTVIRHALGNITVLKKELLQLCESPVRERNGCIEIKGLHVLKIKQWLHHLGF